MADTQDAQHDELTRAVEAAERAGSIVTDHVQSIIDAAQTRAAEIERNAQQEAAEIRTEAHRAATRVLKRIDSMETRLGGVVSQLRNDAAKLSGSLDEQRR